MSALKEIAKQVSHWEGYYRMSKGKAFTLWYAINELELDEDAALEAVQFDGGNDKSIDLFHVDDQYQRIVIAQGRFNAKGQAKPSAGDLLQLVHAEDWLSNPEDLRREGRPDLADAAKDYLEAIARGYATEYHFVYVGPRKKDLETTAAQFNSKHNAMVPPHSVRVVAGPDLEDIFGQASGRRARIPEATLSAAPEDTVEVRGQYGTALVTAVSGTDLKRLYEAHRDSLFDRNVRLFLGARKGTVNAGIRETLASEPGRKNFWAYNNGLTLVCDGYSYDRAAGTVSLRNFSIVNGCQTTVSVANAPPGAGKDVRVLARIIASSDESIVDDIIQFTNRQTPIQPWDLSTQDRVQKKLKAELAAGEMPFFYALRRGETRQLAGARRKAFTRDGKLRVIEMSALGQYLGAMNGVPMVAYKDKGRLFTSHKDDVFPGSLKAEQAILAWVAGEAAEEVVREAIRDAAVRGDHDIQRILKRGGKLFVLSAMAILLRERNGNTYTTRIARKSVASKATRQRLLKYATIAKELYVQSMKERIEKGEELSHIVRSQEHYPKLRDRILSGFKVLATAEAFIKEALPKL